MMEQTRNDQMIVPRQQSRAYTGNNKRGAVYTLEPGASSLCDGLRTRRGAKPGVTGPDTARGGRREGLTSLQ